MPRLCIDPGHGGRDSGGVGINIVGPDNYESHEVLAIGLALADMAQAAGIEVMMTRTSDVFVSITDRWQRANAWRADLFCSIHTNASGGRGIEVLYGKAQYAGLAKQLAQEIHVATGWSLRRDAGGYYKPSGVGVIKNTTMPALLSESGFIDVAEENAAMDTDQWTVDIAQAHLRFVLSYFGLAAGEEDEKVVDLDKQELREQGQGIFKGKDVDVFSGAGSGADYLHVRINAEETRKLMVFINVYYPAPRDLAPQVLDSDSWRGKVIKLSDMGLGADEDAWISAHLLPEDSARFRGFMRP